MNFIKKIVVDYGNIDIEYAKKIADGIDYFTEFCTDYDIKCEETCPFYSLCGVRSSAIISKFVEYAESHVE